MSERGKVHQAPRGRHSPGAHSVSGYIPAALDAAGEDINPFRASSRPTSKFETAAAVVAGWLEPLTSRLVYAFRVAAVASLGVGDLLRRRLGTALVIAGAVISLGIGVVLGGAGNSVSASLPGVQTSTHGTTAKDWGELNSALPAGTTGSSSGKSQAPNTPASAGSVVGGGALAGSNTTGPLSGANNSTSHSQPPSTTAPASSGDGAAPASSGGSGSGGGTNPASTPTTSPPTGGTTPTTRPPTTTTTRPPTTTTTTSPPTTTTTQAPPPTTTTTTQPCSQLQHFLGQC